MYSSNQHIIRALKAGVHGYVVKASASDELVEAIRTVHGGQRHLSPKISNALIDVFLQESTNNELQDPLTQLTSSERQILQLVAEGKTSNEIAELIHLSSKTVESYRSRLMKKLDLSDLPSLVKFAIQHGLTSLVIRPFRKIITRKNRRIYLEWRWLFLTNWVSYRIGKYKNQSQNYDQILAVDATHL